MMSLNSFKWTIKNKSLNILITRWPSEEAETATEDEAEVSRVIVATKSINTGTKKRIQGTQEVNQPVTTTSNKTL